MPAAPLIGQVIESETQPGVRYVLERPVGEGGMGSAYLARREARGESALVVVKVMDLSIGEGQVPPELVAMKEAVALGRLNEKVPPTPFVVRLVDAGSARLAGERLAPWTAVEYVHGGVEGTTLEDRVTYSVHKTGYAFDARRATHALRCLAAGLTAIHGVDVIHRNLSPGNVLCCGFGESEIFKIADFGVSRTRGVGRTFAGVSLGTVGYTAPESGWPVVGPSTDVFSLASVIYFLLTGQRYFDTDEPDDAKRLVKSPHRPSIADHATLSPELFESPATCLAVDAVLARATAARPAERQQSAEQFAVSLHAALGQEDAGPHSSRRLLAAVVSARSSAEEGEYAWTVRSRPRDSLALGSVAWDTDGRALALSQNGAQFWNGQAWLDASLLLARVPAGLTFTQRYEAGGWLVGGSGGALSVLDASGVSDRVEGPHQDLAFSAASGRIGDLLLAVGARRGQALMLWTYSGRRWLKPHPLASVAHIATLQRLDDARWLLGGRLLDGQGFAAIYAPLDWQLEILATPLLRSFDGGASAAERSAALLVGSQGVVLRVEAGAAAVSVVAGQPDLTAVAVDVLDREWTASVGSLFSRDARRGEPWRRVWHDATWSAPFISMLADAGIVVAMTADGGIIEGRSTSLPIVG